MKIFFHPLNRADTFLGQLSGYTNRVAFLEVGNYISVLILFLLDGKTPLLFDLSAPLLHLLLAPCGIVPVVVCLFSGLVYNASSALFTPSL